jgi:hypothetical protein
MEPVEASGGCACGHVRYATNGTPLFRAYCHCLICQEYNQADRADIIVMRSTDVMVHAADRIAFRSHAAPPLLQRGRCRRCGGVAIEKMRIPLMPRLTILPAQTLDDSGGFPGSSFHMFYHRRVADADDALPRHSTYLSSQLAFSSGLLRALRR